MRFSLTGNKNLFILLFAVVFFSSCTQLDVFEKNTTIPGMKWNTNFIATGAVNISDTVSAYKIYIVMRHTDAYNYNNIWLNTGLQAPGDSMKFQKINLTLGNDASGWEGSGMNDIWEVRKLISGVPKRFIRSGLYNFSIQHVMRDDPLREVMSIGIRLEKAR